MNSTQLKTQLSKNLKYLRGINHWTQEYCSARAGISRSKWATYEEQRALPKVDQIIKITELFFVSFDELFTLDLSTHKRVYTTPRADSNYFVRHNL